MSHKEQFSLLIVRGDGVRVLRFNFRRRVAGGAFVVVAVLVSVLGALLGDWWQVRQRLRDSASLIQEVTEQRAIIDSFNRRVADLRREASAWREMHARILEPFGPDLAPTSRSTGIGGAPAPAPDGVSAPRRPSPSDELNRLADSVMEEGETLRALDRLIARARKALTSLPSRWPVRGAVNSDYGTRRSPWTKTSEFHGGIDIAAERGSPVSAPAAGTVVFAGSHAEYGLTVIVEHNQDLKTIYGHLSKIGVHLGQRVERGAPLGLTGNTGRSSGPHLHYEIVVKGQPVNPRAYLWD